MLRFGFLDRSVGPILAAGRPEKVWILVLVKPVDSKRLAKH